ncbi:hypothetical protein HGRIS_002163 [Hohenbuehelia grisea]|uniref:Uncharacterized protein n=1 Tax=Hohenbuehelia grisea TaxID=104357 RepID=A0ABR3JJP1_9AGAR
MTSYRGTPAVPADIITYRRDDKLVFVQPAADYTGGLTEARKVFPELLNIPNERINFYITATMSGTRTQVRISESAWAPAIARLLRGEVVDIVVDRKPETMDMRQLQDAPPMYLDVPDSKEAMEYRMSRSCPGSRVQSRQSSPSARSVKSTDKSSRSWWQLH